MTIWQPDGRNGKPRSISRSRPRRVSPVECAQLRVEAELLAVVADEVEDGQHGLVAGAAQSAAELLQEDRRALGRSEEQHGVDVGEVEALVEQVGGEEHVDPARLAGPRGRARGRPAGVSPLTASAGMPASLNVCGHELGVGDADAEAERAHGAGSSTLSRSCWSTIAARASVAGVDVRQLALVVPATGPADPPQVGAVGDGEVVERAEQVCAERVPQPQLGGGAAVEERARTSTPSARSGVAVRPSSSRGVEVVEEPSVGRRLRRGGTRR